MDFQRSVISKRYKQPYINKILDQVQNWDEQLVEYFISDKPTSTTVMSTLNSNTTTNNNNNNNKITPINNSENQTMKRSFLPNHNNDINGEELLLYRSTKRRCFDKNIPNQNACTNEKTSYLSAVSSTSRYGTSPSIYLSSQTSTSTNNNEEDDIAMIDSKTEQLNAVEDIEKGNELFVVINNNDNDDVEDNINEKDEEEEGEIVEDDDDDDFCDDSSNDIPNERHYKYKLLLK